MSDDKKTTKNTEKKPVKHIIVDELAFEKLNGFKNLLRAYTDKRITNSIALEMLIELATDKLLEKVEAEGDKAILELSRMIDELSAKRGRKVKKHKEINLDELMKELKKLKE